MAPEIVNNTALALWLEVEWSIPNWNKTWQIEMIISY